MGTKHLQKTLNEMLGKHIKNKMPSIRKGLENTLRELRQDDLSLVNLFVK